jgi:predicted negative regulator of RcsB-dependent stress response
VYVTFFSCCIASDSIPTWQIVYSKIYHQQFVKENTEHDITLLQQQNEQFHQLVAQYFNTALDLIPVFSGVKWQPNYHIDIFPSRTEVSYSHPLTITYNSNQYFMFYTLIHEAVHHNINIEFPTRYMDEALCDKVASKVALYIDSVIYSHRKYSVYYGLQSFYPWNLDSLSVNEWWIVNENAVLKAVELNKQFESALFHQDEKAIKLKFTAVQSTMYNEFREVAYLKMIDHYETTTKNFSEAEKTARHYLADFKTGSFYHLIQFKLAYLLLRDNKKDAALSVLAKMKKSTTGINNYLDDLHLLLGKLEVGQSNSVEAAGHFLYIIEMLPNGLAKADAYRNLARIYTRLDKRELAASMYHFAFEHSQRNDERAQILIEMNPLRDKLSIKQYKLNIVSVLRQPLKPSIIRQLEQIYKALLNN